MMPTDRPLHYHKGVTYEAAEQSPGGGGGAGAGGALPHPRSHFAAHSGYRLMADSDQNEPEQTRIRST
jgi:hypothetical protein